MWSAALGAYGGPMVHPAPPSTRRSRSTVLAALAVAGLALTGVVAFKSLAPSPPAIASPPDTLRTARPAAPGVAGAIPQGVTVARTGHRGPVGEADGVVPNGTTVFDDGVPGVANLDPALLGALRLAGTDAADDGIELFVDSGWRTKAYQAQLLRQAISTYGSEKEAARWVATPTTSAHVTGDAVDIGHDDARAWLSTHGASYGLCQVYRNEPWHYELRPEAVDHGCPPSYADPTDDPRMQG
jgi:zinc D-Ala-D-Ala carboxypeptidase